MHVTISDRQALQLCYRSLAEEASVRVGNPGSGVLGPAWALGAWYRMRKDFRTSRPDRISMIDGIGEYFDDDPAHGLDTYMATLWTLPKHII